MIKKILNLLLGIVVFANMMVLPINAQTQIDRKSDELLILTHEKNEYERREYIELPEEHRINSISLSYEFDPQTKYLSIVTIGSGYGTHLQLIAEGEQIDNESYLCETEMRINESYKPGDEFEDGEIADKFQCLVSTNAYENTEKRLSLKMKMNGPGSIHANALFMTYGRTADDRDYIYYSDTDFVTGDYWINITPEEFYGMETQPEITIQSLLAMTNGWFVEVEKNTYDISPNLTIEDVEKVDYLYNELFPWDETEDGFEVQKNIFFATMLLNAKMNEQEIRISRDLTLGLVGSGSRVTIDEIQKLKSLDVESILKVLGIDVFVFEKIQPGFINVSFETNIESILPTPGEYSFVVSYKDNSRLLGEGKSLSLSLPITVVNNNENLTDETSENVLPNTGENTNESLTFGIILIALGIILLFFKKKFDIQAK